MGDSARSPDTAARGLLTSARLAAGSGVRIWCWRTDAPVDVDILSPEERQRASRFHFARDRDRWVAARVHLRRILGEVTGTPPRDLRFCYSNYGKPALVGSSVRFNLSHSGDVAVCAVCRTRDVGVDVEQIRTMDDLEVLFCSIASRHERAVFQHLSRDARLREFFRCWTIKEACIKASGEGLSRPVQGIEVLTANGNCLLRCGEEAWSVTEFRPSPGYAAALAVKMQAEKMSERGDTLID
jgi:4'-phosphopantetheinyl transferase